MILACKYITENLSGNKDTLKKSFTEKTSRNSVSGTFFLRVLCFCSESSVLLNKYARIVGMCPHSLTGFTSETVCVHRFKYLMPEVMIMLPNFCK